MCPYSYTVGPQAYIRNSPPSIGESSSSCPVRVLKRRRIIKQGFYSRFRPEKSEMVKGLSDCSSAPYARLSLPLIGPAVKSFRPGLRMPREIRSGRKLQSTRSLRHAHHETPSASDGSALSALSANSPASNRGHAAAAIIAALSVESASVGNATVTPC